ncbi:hypothetical protein GQ44DRAFT_777975 [Phaeosphaeriaceae sp. PMI808]|nr:hypothetical protein GQ44DRAFT_777975 [Phaeosphaeriaceae sp. PMI808]
MDFSKEYYTTVLLELVCQSHANPANNLLLTDKHVQHFATTAEEFLHTVPDHSQIAIALPPLVNRSSYHCAHIDVRKRLIVYHGVFSAESDSCGANHRPHTYGKGAAIKYAVDNWAQDLLSLTRGEEVSESKNTNDLLCEELESRADDGSLARQAIERQMQQLRPRYAVSRL